MEHHEIRIGHKVYDVTIRDSGEVSIWTHWQVPSVADRWSARPMMIDKSTSVSPYGRLGKQIIAALPVEAQAFISGVF
jgi:hypothetical protein